METGYLKSYDGTELAYYLFKSDKPKYIVQIAHGMQEYSKTYFEFAEFLAKNKCIVFLFDERGHGKTVANKTLLGKVQGDIFEQTVKDEIFVSKMLKEKYNLPLIYFGHSYGSFIGQEYLQNCNLAEKIILSGSAYMKVPKIFLGKTLAGIRRKLLGDNSMAGLLEKMSLKAYAKKFKDNGCWITSDENKTKEFYSDELNGTPFTTGFYYYMFKHQYNLYEKDKLTNSNKNAKLLIVSGDKDAVGENGKLSTKLYENYKNYNYDVQFILYPEMRHGIIQEKNRLTVFNDILKFINN